MNYSEQEIIFNSLKVKSLKVKKIFRKEFMLIELNSFIPYKKYFSTGIKIGTKINYRSDRYIKHIHAIKYDDKIEIHFDYGNLYKFLPLGLIHFFYDVIPYFLWHLIKLKKPYSLK